MRRASKNAQAVSKENALLQPLHKIVKLGLPDDEIELTPEKPQQELDLNFFDHSQQKAGMSFPPSTDRKRHNAARETRQRAKRYDTSMTFPDCLDPCFSEIHFVPDQSGVRVQKLSKTGRSDARRPPLKQLDPQLPFQPIHRLRKSWL